MAIKRATQTTIPATATGSEAQKEKLGLQLLTPLETEVKAVTVTTAEQYEQADQLLSKILRARKTWKAEWYGEDGKSGIIPLQSQALDKQYALIRKVDRPLETLEKTVKEAMREFKVEERRQIQAAEAETARLQAQIEAAERKEAEARTPQMAGRARAQVQDLLVKQESVGDSKPMVAVGFSSSSRVIKKWRVNNMLAFIEACLDGTYDPSWLDVSETGKKFLDQQLKEDPQTLAAFPGIEVYEDLNIVGR